MVSATVGRNILGIFGNLITFALFFSPLPTFYNIIKSKTDYSSRPHLGHIPVNVSGLLTQLVYLLIFSIFADSKGREKLGISLVIQLILMATTVTVVLNETQNRALMMGIICNTFNMVIYISSLTGVMEMIRTKSVKHMSLGVSFTSFLNACVWTAYAILKHDIYMLINNGVGVISGCSGDVWNPQPAPKDHPWRYMPNQAMTPHISGTTIDAQLRYAAGVKDMLDRYFKGQDFPAQNYIVKEGELAPQYR
ncbi:Formate dehydrogenase, mitochondrial, partial [Cucurbita argyrosperma subsp. sororia]